MNDRPTPEALLRSVIGSAFEAGRRAAARSPADRDREKAKCQDYGVTMLAGFMEAELARALKEASHG